MSPSNDNINCHHCGTSNLPEHSFCHACGARFSRVRVCQHCYRSNSAEYKFCVNCGGVLSDGGASGEVSVSGTSGMTAIARTLQNIPVSGVLCALEQAQASLGSLLDRYESGPSRVVEIALVATLTIIA